MASCVISRNHHLRVSGTWHTFLLGLPESWHAGRPTPTHFSTSSCCLLANARKFSPSFYWGGHRLTTFFLALPDGSDRARIRTGVFCLHDPFFFFFFCSHSSWDLEQTRPITPPDLMLFSPPHGPLFSFLSYPNLPPKLPPPPFPKYPEFYSFFPVWSCLYNWPFHPFIMFPLVPFFLMQALCPSEILQTFLQKPPDFSWGSPHVRNLRGVKRTGAQQMHVRLSYISEIQTAPHPRLSIRDTPTSCIYYVNYIYVWAFLNIFNEDRMRLRLFSAVLGDQKSRDSWQVCYS